MSLLFDHTGMGAEVNLGVNLQGKGITKRGHMMARGSPNI